MINLILDTNILHQEGLHSTRMQRLQRLIQSNDIKITIPEIVIREYISKIKLNAKKELEKIEASIDDLRRKKIITEKIYEETFFINKINEDISAIDKTIDAWLKDNKIITYPISKTSLNTIFDHYFNGTGCFREAKKRDDIPDAVIYDAIISMSKQEKVYVIVKDGALFKSLQNKENINLYDSLDELLNSDILKEKNQLIDRDDENVHKIIDYLNSLDCIMEIEEHLKNTEPFFVNNYYNNDFIVFPYDFDDINVIEPEIRPIIDPNDYLELSNPNYLGHGNFSYDLTLDSKCQLSFYCTEDEFESLPHKLRKKLTLEIIEHGKRYKATGILRVDFKGSLTLSNIDTELKIDQLKIHFSYLGAKNCDIEITPQLDCAEVNEIDWI